MHLRFFLTFVCCSLFLGGSIRAEFIPNDTFYTSHQWYAPLIRLPLAWDISTGSSDVKVAVIDRGVITTTPDLATNLLPPQSIIGISPFPNSILMGSEGLRHGTNVASVAAMTLNNGAGGAGVGNFSIQPIIVPLTSTQPTPDQVAEAIQLAADSGSRVIVCSIRLDNYAPANVAAQYARSKGALVFFAAGNSDSDRMLPDYSDIIFVGGSNRVDGRWRNLNPDGSPTGVGSSFGDYIDLVAPAEAIVVANPLSTNINNFGALNGTSFAAPLAGGVAALAWSINPNLTPDQVEQMLYAGAVDLPGDWDGAGRLDAYSVAQLAVASIPEPSTLVMLAGFLVLSVAVLWYRRSRRSRNTLQPTKVINPNQLAKQSIISSNPYQSPQTVAWQSEEPVDQPTTEQQSTSQLPAGIL